MSRAVLVKRELVLGGLTCAHCAEVIGETVKHITGVESSNLNFVSKKLTFVINIVVNKDDVLLIRHVS